MLCPKEFLSLNKTICLLASVLLLTLSCNKEKKDYIIVDFNPETSYTLKETNVNALYSDSGITKAKVITPVWLIYGKASEPYWYFPEGANLEKFDSVFNVVIKMQSDTVYYYEKRKLWKMDGNVDISNLDGTRFQTSQLFCDESKRIFYSDSFIKITKDGNINTGTGFLSNEDMSKYEIYKSGGEFAFETNNKHNTGDSLPSAPKDSI